jgi:hypothetical protein
MITVFFGKLRVWPRVASSRTIGSPMAAIICSVELTVRPSQHDVSTCRRVIMRAVAAAAMPKVHAPPAGAVRQSRARGRGARSEV